MANLTVAQLASRRAHDYECMRLTFDEPVGQQVVRRWEAYHSEADRVAGRQATDTKRACVYVVELQVKSLVGPGQYHQNWTVRIDASGDNFPGEMNWPTVISPTKPWSPHFSTSGSVCIGNIWQPNLSMAEFVIAIVRLLNFDEDIRSLERDYAGFNEAATGYWKKSLAGRPLDANLRYPVPRSPADAMRAASLFGATTIQKAGPAVSVSPFGTLPFGTPTRRG